MCYFNSMSAVVTLHCCFPVLADSHCSYNCTRNVSTIFHPISKFLAKFTFRIFKTIFLHQPCGTMSLNPWSVCDTVLMYVLSFLLDCVASHWALSGLKHEIKGRIICLQMLQWHRQEFKCHQHQGILPQMHRSFLISPFSRLPFWGSWVSVGSKCGMLVWILRSTVFGRRSVSWSWWDDNVDAGRK